MGFFGRLEKLAVLEDVGRAEKKRIGKVKVTQTFCLERFVFL